MTRSIPVLLAAFVLSACASHPKECTSCAADTPAKSDGFVSLFDGKSLDGWKPNENPASFTVRDGMIVVHGTRSHLFYTGPVHNHDFKNFHLKAQVKTEPNSNSGIYFHTAFQDSGWPAKGFEAQVNNSHADRKRTGGLYSVKDVMDIPPAKDGQWFDYDIIVQGKHVVIEINGKITADWTQPDDWQPPQGMPARMIGWGTFALQGHDPGSTVYFKNIRVKALP